MSTRDKYTFSIVVPAEGSCQSYADGSLLGPADKYVTVEVEQDPTRHAHRVSFSDGSRASVSSKYLQAYGRGDGPVAAIHRMLLDMLKAKTPQGYNSLAICLESFMQDRRKMEESQRQQMQNMGMQGFVMGQQRAQQAQLGLLGQAQKACAPPLLRERRFDQGSIAPAKPKHPNLAWLDQRINEISVNLADIGVI